MLRNFINKIKKNEYQYFFVKLLAFLFIVFLLDLSIGKVLSHFYFNQKHGVEYRTIYSIEKTKADILIFGSSRAVHNFNAGIFEERFKQPCYDVGRNGNLIIYHYAVLQSVLKRYKPKMIILEFNDGEFEKSQDSYDRESALLPFYRTHPELRPIIELRGPYEKIKHFSYIYPYNSLIFTIASGISEAGKSRHGHFDIKGYVPLTEVYDEPIRTVNYTKEYPLDSVPLNMYKSFIKECKENNIQLYIVCAPYFFISNGTDHSLHTAQKIATENNISYLDYSRDTFFMNRPALFADTIHFNSKGADIFTNKLIDTILTIKKAGPNEAKISTIAGNYLSSVVSKQ